METFQGTISRVPLVRDRVIFSAMTIDDKPVQIVLFRQSRPIHLGETLKALKVGDPITISGKRDLNTKTSEPQIIIDDIITNPTTNTNTIESSYTCPTCGSAVSEQVVNPFPDQSEEEERRFRQAHTDWR